MDITTIQEMAKEEESTEELTPDYSFLCRKLVIVPQNLFLKTSSLAGDKLRNIFY
jgi:hypothetical protein